MLDLVHFNRQNCELVSIDEVLRLFIDKIPDHVGFVPQQSSDKIGDFSIDNRRFCLQVCTKPYTRWYWRSLSKSIGELL